MSDFIYLDHAATTPLDPRVLETMLSVMRQEFGNASSVHRAGRKARFLVEDARERVAQHLGAETSEIIFTSGGTESNNAAVSSVRPQGVVLTTYAEHEAVLRPVERFGDSGGRVVYVPVDSNGIVTAALLQRAVVELPPGFLASIMYVNNETGAVTDVERLAEVVHGAGGYFHCDAVQAAGLMQVNVDTLGADMMTISGHKFYGPKGAGVLYVRGGTPFDVFIMGGSQERGRRAGTENVAAIVGLATAMDLAAEEAEPRYLHIRDLQERMMRGIYANLGQVVCFNTPEREEQRAPHIVNIAFPPADGRAVDGEMLLLGLDVDGVCASSGSACTSGTIRPSHVLRAMGRSEETSKAAVRFSIGKDNTTEEIDIALGVLERVAARVTSSETAHR